MADIAHDNIGKAPRASREGKETQCQHLEGGDELSNDVPTKNDLDETDAGREIGPAERKLVRKLDLVMLPTLWIMYASPSDLAAYVTCLMAPQVLVQLPGPERNHSCSPRRPGR